MTITIGIVLVEFLAPRCLRYNRNNNVTLSWTSSSASCGVDQNFPSANR